jgi:hypothetical protein
MFVIVNDYDKKYNAVVKAIYSLNRIFTLGDIMKKVDTSFISKQDVIAVTNNLKNIGIVEEGFFTYKRIK